MVASSGDAPITTSFYRSGGSVFRIKLRAARVVPPRQVRRYIPTFTLGFLVDTCLEWIYIIPMEYNKDKVDDLVLALLHLTSFRDHEVVRAWKGHDWDALDRLCDKGFISDPKSKSKSVVLSDVGVRRAQELFQMFCGS